MERKLGVVGEMITACDVLSHPLQMLGEGGGGGQLGDGTGTRPVPLFPPPQSVRNNDNNKRANSSATTMKMTNCGADPSDE